MQSNPSDDELFQLILGLEDQLEEEGLDPADRAFHLPNRAMEALGYESFALIEGSPTNALFERVRYIHSMLYRPKDVAAGGLHAGAFMFRGIATLIEIPYVFGSVKIDLLELCDLTENQKVWLSKREHELSAYCDTAIDLLDFTGGFFRMGGFKPLPKASIPLFFLARSHLQAAAATLCATLDTRGCVQSAILGSELALKAAISGAGATAKDLKKLGHNQLKLAAAVSSAYPSISATGLTRSVKVLPAYVSNRYSMTQPSYREAGTIVMAAQYNAGETIRAVCDSSFRRDASSAS